MAGTIQGQAWEHGPAIGSTRFCCKGRGAMWMAGAFPGSSLGTWPAIGSTRLYCKGRGVMWMAGTIPQGQLRTWAGYRLCPGSCPGQSRRRARTLQRYQPFTARMIAAQRSSTGRIVSAFSDGRLTGHAVHAEILIALDQVDVLASDRRWKYRTESDRVPPRPPSDESAGSGRSAASGDPAVICGIQPSP